MSDYLSPEQVGVLLRPLNPSRVKVLDGMSHLEAWDVRAHLNRCFGFARWSADVRDVTLLYETPTQTKAGKPAFAVAYRVTLQLTINAPDGTRLATYSEAAVGDALMPDFKHADAHDFALKAAESQALKRCAINLGDQFGLSLYDNGSTSAAVKKVLVGMSPDLPAEITETAQAAAVAANQPELPVARAEPRRVRVAPARALAAEPGLVSPDQTYTTPEAAF